ncbi:MAG TPA: hypothetical protein PLP42_12300 [Acidobacteriota bacterium]|nr:hypothetical protein [Acidobacteriota bacterium]
MDSATQLFWLAMLALPVASVSWTVTHEEIFREMREYFENRSKSSRIRAGRKLHYLVTCEYCFSHYVALAFALLTGFTLLINDWRGYLISTLALVWIANIYMTIYARLRVTLRKERVEAQQKDQERQADKSE